MICVFMGTPNFSVPTLRMLVEHGYDVKAVVTQPDRPKGRGQTIVLPPVKVFAAQHDIPVLQPKKARTPEIQATLRELFPDVIVVVAYGQILPESILQIPRLGCINVHASLLPKYRGAAPIQWAIIQGEQETGVTTMFMDKGMDTGDILLQRTVPIMPDDTAGSLHDTLAEVGAETLLETLQQMEAGTLIPIPQHHEQASYAPLLKKGDGQIRWQEPAIRIRNTVRGLFPWPGAYTHFQGKVVKLLSVRVAEHPPDAGEAPPGTIVALDARTGPLIATGKGTLRILEVQPENKRPMRCNDFCRGYHLQIGSQLGA